MIPFLREPTRVYALDGSGRLVAEITFPETRPGVADAVLGALCRKKGLSPAILTSFDPAAYKERQYDLLAQAVRDNLDMELVHRILDRTV